MPKIRSKNDRSAIYDIGAHHDVPPIKIVPTQTRKPSGGCAIEVRKRLCVSSDRQLVALAARKVVRFASEENIARLSELKAHLVNSKNLLMDHLIECETCGKVTE